MSKKANYTILIFLQSLLLNLEANSQRFYIMHEGPRMMCGGGEIYYGVKNRVILIEETKLRVGRYDLVSDSVTIERGNDSLFFLTSLYKNRTCKIYVIDTISGQKVFSLPVFCNASPVRFLISPLPADAHRHQFPKIFIPSIDRVRMESRMHDCYNYTARLKLLSCRLCLIRGTGEIAFIRLNRKQKVGEGFKKELMEKCQNGDHIALRDIVLKNKDGSKIHVTDYFIYGVW